MVKKNSLISFVFILCIFLFFQSNGIACTGFMMEKDGLVLTGHNKDWWSPDSYIRSYPAEESKFGRMYFEIPYPIVFSNSYNVLAGGMNDQGLFYESYVTPLLFASFELFKPPLFKTPVTYLMERCSTVAEVVDYIESHNLFFLNYLLGSGQVFVIDKTGDAAIIEGDEIIRKTQDFQICTNFLQSNPGLGNYPCWRYETAEEMLVNTTELSIPRFEEILNATQQEGFTQYSTICDLNNGIMKVYHFQDYEHPIEFDIHEETSMDEHSYYLPSLFEPASNQAPLKPETPIGPSNGKKDEQYIYQTNTTDPDNPPEEIYYKWEFSDGTQSYWLLNREPYGGKVAKTWEKQGTYTVRVKARDIYGKESPWSDPLEVSMPKTKICSMESLRFVIKQFRI